MTFRNGYVAVIMQNGRPVRQQAGTCILPFGSEYQILLKNKTLGRVRADIFIDGAPASDSSYIIDAHSSSLIKRFALDGDLEKGNAFKFVKKEETESEVDSSNFDFGIIEVKFYPECPSYQFNNWPGNLIIEKGPDYYGAEFTVGTRTGDPMPKSPEVYACTTPQVGGTVQGQAVAQQFTATDWAGDLWASTVIRIKLMGPKVHETGSTRYCTVCGNEIDRIWKFCTSCGTQLA